MTARDKTKKKGILRRLLKIGLFTLYLLVLCELSLRFLAFFYISRLPESRAQRKRQGEYLIYLLGDSHAYGMGAPRGMSIAEQLSNLLNKYSTTGRKYIIKNFGMPSWNSSQVLRRLKQKVDIQVPELVIVFAGKNNIHNFYNSNLFKLYPPKRLEHWIFVKIQSVIENLRIFRALKYLRYRDDIQWFTREWSHSEYKTLLTSDEAQYRVARYDFGKMNELGITNGFQVLFLTYPPTREFNQLIPLHRALMDSNLTVIDNRPLFGLFFDQYRDLVMFWDGHPNLLGYCLITLNIMHYITQNDMLDDRFDGYIDPLNAKIHDPSDIDFISVLEDIFDEPLEKSVIKEISTDEAVFYLYRFKVRDTIVKLFYLDRQPLFIRYPGDIVNFDFKIPMRLRLTEQQLAYFAGEPDKKYSYYDNPRITLFDQKWVFEDIFILIVFLLKDGKVRYAFSEWSADFNTYQTDILEMKPTLEEIQQIFTLPQELSEHDGYKILEIFTDKQILRIRLEADRLVQWEIERR